MAVSKFRALVPLTALALVAGAVSAAQPAAAAPTLVITPATAERVVGQAHTVTVNVNDDGPRSGVDVVFTIAGAATNPPPVATDSNGNAAITYTADEAGLDTITACVDQNEAAPCSAADGDATTTATVNWLRPGTATAPCDDAAESCVVSPIAGPDNRFVVRGSDGSSDAVLIATVGRTGPAPLSFSAASTTAIDPAAFTPGSAPNCPGYSERSEDWVRFAFTDAAAGKTWRKDVELTGTRVFESKKKARKELGKTKVCFAAPYKFLTAKGYERKKRGPENDWQGVLPTCGSKHFQAGKKDHRRWARPCVTEHKLRRSGDGWVLFVAFRVPAGELDPKGRS